MASATLKGIYVLIIRLDRDIAVNVGAKGRFTFGEGLYAYAGSAQNNLEKRVNRHLRRDKRKFWHVDYLLDNCAAKVMEVLYKEGEKSEECKVAEALGEICGLVAGFGASDCGCRSHLFKIYDYGLLEKLMYRLDFESSCLREEHGE